MTTRLLIDDLRSWSEVLGDALASKRDTQLIARTFGAGIDALSKFRWDELYLDHDLSDFEDDGNGHDIMQWLSLRPRCWPGKIIFVTANPLGRVKMELVLARMRKAGYRG